MKKTRPQCGLLLENGEGRVLLQLRDNNPAIPYPGCWGTFGGQIEEDEEPHEAIVREIKEELHYNLVDPELYQTYQFDGYDIYMFRKHDADIKVSSLTVCEGQRAGFFALNEVQQLPCAFNCRMIVENYFNIFSK
ncbi:MAG: NUDIX domain-containing protein, partial [Deltaproteobacteria bacterium]|nr:NUDIX domain-containing protein [Deltaproteobacteria bacterium]